MRLIAALGALLVGALVFLGLGYLLVWSHTHPDYSRCLWNDTSCALSVATYFLAFATTGAFIAAYHAAIYAFETFRISQQTLQLEASRTLAVSRCKDEEHQVADANIMLRPDYTIVLEAPTEEEQTIYYEMSYEFTSLGRTPIVNPQICLSLSYRRRGAEAAERDGAEQIVQIPSLRTGDRAHVRIWIAPDLLKVVMLAWARDATQDEKQNRVPLDFHSIPSERPEFCGVRRFESALVLSPRQTSAQPPIIPQQKTPTEDSGSNGA